MMNLLKNTKVTGAAVVIIVLLLGWWYWSSTSSSSSDAVSQAPAATDPGSQDLLTLLGSLHSITLDPSIFSDPNFEALSDFGVTIPDEAAGRRDPFAPVGTPEPTQTQTTGTAGQ